MLEGVYVYLYVLNVSLCSYVWWFYAKRRARDCVCKRVYVRVCAYLYSCLIITTRSRSSSNNTSGRGFCVCVCVCV